MNLEGTGRWLLGIVLFAGGAVVALGGLPALASEEVPISPGTPARLATLLPTSLQITPGASGSLTLTLSTAQATEALVQLSTSDPRVVGLPTEGTVPVPAGERSQTFAVFGVSPGTATITAALSGSAAQSQVTVLVVPASIVSLLPPSLPLTEGSRGTLTLTLNASQPTATEVLLSTSDAAIVGLPGDRVVVPANSLTASFPVTGVSRGLATVTASLAGSSATAAIEVVPPPPRVQALSCPSSLVVTATGVCTVRLNATQVAETSVSLGLDPSGVLAAPAEVTVPARTLSAEFAVTALAPGEAGLTAGPLNGTSQKVTLQVLPPPPTIAGLAPPEGAFVVGATATFTLSLNAAQPTETVVPVALAPPGIASGPGAVTVPAGSLTAPVPIMALAPGGAILTVGPLNGTQAESRVTVTELPPTVTRLSPGSLSLPKGKAGTLTVTIAPSVPAPTVVPLASTDPLTVEVPGSVTIPAGERAALFPVLARSEGTATLTAGPLNGAREQATITVIPAALVALTVTPPAPTLAPGQTQQFTAKGTLTDGSTRDVTDRVTWTSSDEAVATVSSPGGLTIAVAPGTSTIMATHAEGLGASARLTVVAAASAATAPSPGTAQPGSSAPAAAPEASRSAVPAPQGAVAQGGTALAGRILDTERRPIAGVTIVMPLGSRELRAVTDTTGHFRLDDPPAGDQLILIDGETASTAAAKYPTIPVTVTIRPRGVTQLHYVPHLHRQQDHHFTPIAPGQETVATDPDLPGVKLRIPAGAQIIGWDGQPNTRVSIRTVPVGRLPVPPIPSQAGMRTVYMFYFGKRGGGIATHPIPFEAPNDLGLTPGEKADLWYFAESPLPGVGPNAWRTAGTGTVSADGRIIRTDPGVGLPSFCCGAAGYGPLRGDAQVPGPTPRPGQGVPGGDPVDLSTGIFLLTKTDLVVPGRLPVVLTRTYRSGEALRGPFGRGTTLTYDDYLEATSTDVFTYISAGNAKTPFARQADGSYLNTDVPFFRGARLTVNADNTKTLRFKDGTALVFDVSGVQSRARDRVGNEVYIGRLFSSNPTTLREPAGRSLELSWVSALRDRVTSVRDPLGRTVLYEYDTDERLVAVTDPAGGITRYAYDTQHRLTSITDPRGIVFLRNTYDGNSRVCQQERADGGTFTFYYVTADIATLPESQQLLAEAAAGGPITQAPCTGPASSAIVVATVLVDPRGKPTTSHFNGQGYLTSHVNALGQTTTYEREPGTNLLLSVTDPLNRVTRYAYDATGNVTTVTDPLNHTRTFTYEATFNQVTSSVDPLGNTTTLEYDPQGNLIALTDPEQITKPEAERLKTRITYNQFGQPISITGVLSQTTSFTYNTEGDLVSLTDPLTRTVQRGYDAVSRLLVQTDPLGRTTRFSYDALNHLVAITDALGGTTSFTHDPNGNLLTVTDPRGSVTRYGYDSMDRVATRMDPLLRAESFQYDLGGNLTQVTDRKGQVTTFGYDALSRRTQAAFADASTLTYTYDAGDRLTQVGDSLSGTITRTYDALDRLLAETTPQGTVTYTYDAAGRRSTMTVAGQPAVTYTFDRADHLTGITQGTASVSLTSDAAGKRTALTLPNGILIEYGYDAAGQLTGLTYRQGTAVLGTLAYSYDGAGSRSQVGGDLGPDRAPPAGGLGNL